MYEESLTMTEKMIWAMSFVKAFESSLDSSLSRKTPITDAEADKALEDAQVFAVKQATFLVGSLRNSGEVVQSVFGEDSQEYAMWRAVLSAR